MTEHEAVELGLGEFERAALLDGILRGDDHERRGQREGVVADGHAPLLHRFEQGALDLGRGAVDFVGQQQVREDRPAMDAELARALIEDFRADDVRGQQVNGELHAGELEVNGLGDGVDEERLGEAGHALKEQVAAGEECNQQPLDHHVLPHDNRRDALADGFAGALLNPNFFMGFHHP